MSEEERIVEEAKRSDDYVCWNFVSLFEKESENDQDRNQWRIGEDLV